MTGDLLVIVPTRGRPQNLARLLVAVTATARADTRVHVAVDDDDPAFAAYFDTWTAWKAGRDGDGDQFESGPRDGLAGWTNTIAVRRAREFRYLASLGDDMVPRTPGWDAALIRAIDEAGGTGVAYPWSGIREDIGEAFAVSSDIVQALGWMCEPALHHWWVDNVIADLGRGIGVFRYLRAIAVDHLHAASGQAPADATYAEAGEKIAADKAAYETWRAERMAADIKLRSGLCGRRRPR